MLLRAETQALTKAQSSEFFKALDQGIIVITYLWLLRRWRAASSSGDARKIDNPERFASLSNKRTAHKGYKE